MKARESRDDAETDPPSEECWPRDPELVECLFSGKSEIILYWFSIDGANNQIQSQGLVSFRARGEVNLGRRFTYMKKYFVGKIKPSPQTPHILHIPALCVSVDLYDGVITKY